MSKVEINVQPLLDKLKARVKEEFGIWDCRQYKGVREKEGQFMLSFGLPNNQRLDVKMSAEKMLQDKTYFDGIYANINDAIKAGQQFRFEQSRIN